MLLEKKEITDSDGVVYYESVFDSTSILKTIFFPNKNRLFISFNRGGTYSYSNINETLYSEFEAADSQGKFLKQNIEKKQEYPYRKEFTLYESEVKEIKEIVVNKKAEINKGLDISGLV